MVCMFRNAIFIIQYLYRGKTVVVDHGVLRYFKIYVIFYV